MGRDSVDYLKVVDIQVLNVEEGMSNIFIMRS